MIKVELASEMLRKVANEMAATPKPRPRPAPTPAPTPTWTTSGGVMTTKPPAPATENGLLPAERTRADFLNRVNPEPRLGQEYQTALGQNERLADKLQDLRQGPLTRAAKFWGKLIGL
jgi:hypothetical protein